MFDLRSRIVCISFCLAFAAANAQTERSGESKRLWDLFDREWQHQLREFPEMASSMGDKRYNDRWSDISLEAVERRHRHDRKVLEELSSFDPAKLDAQDQLNLKLFVKQLQHSVDGHRFRRYLVPLNQRGGIQTSDQLAQRLWFTSEKDYLDWIARLEAFPVRMDQTIALMREGIRVGMVHPKIVMQRLPDQVAAQIVEDPQKSLFYEPFLRMSDEVPDSRAQELAARARKAVSEKVVPAFRKLDRFFRDEYLPACFEQPGVWQAPQGKPLYAYLAKGFTTTDLTPEQIHEIGKREVERIRAEMDKVIAKVEFKGSFQEFLHFLRTDPQFYFQDPKELIAAYREISKRIDPELVRLFGKLPRIPYGVRPIPANIAPDTTTAYYQRPSADGRRAGTYFVNLYQPETRPKYEMEALSLHEAMPGHHLQIALAMELGELPNFRRFGGFTAFVEGWALYGESLGEDLGLYKDPYSKFGQLTYEMWRAVRLVVDTGMHYMAWTRQQAIDFFRANAAKSEQDIVNEIDRYIAWPGQALAYKIGELKIQELRRLAESTLGDRFDVREFHDQLLSYGAIPLDILESAIKEWLSSKTGRQSLGMAGPESASAKTEKN